MKFGLHALLLLFVILPIEGHEPDHRLQSSNLLFDSDELLELTLSGDMRNLLADREGKSEYYDLTLSYSAEGGKISMPIKAKTRGHFRKSFNCIYPPLLLNFSKESTPETSFFNGQDKLKLVTPCANEKYVLREYLVYKVYNLISEKSFKARLVRVVYADSRKSKQSKPLYGILLEDDDQMAGRNNSTPLDTKLVRPEGTDQKTFLRMAVFEYLIGNTDWSVQYRQNIVLLDNTAGSPFTVPYDFDHAGIVAAPYAQPAEELQLRSIRERRYRGYCLQDLAGLNETFSYYDQLRESIYEIYVGNKLLDEKYIRSTTKYLDAFYTTIHQPKKIKVDFGYPCLEGGTGNIVIKGLSRE